jgi:hypothetical protein
VNSSSSQIYRVLSRDYKVEVENRVSWGLETEQPLLSVNYQHDKAVRYSSSKRRGRAEDVQLTMKMFDV